jgi:hypothetical protein
MSPNMESSKSKGCCADCIDLCISDCQSFNQTAENNQSTKFVYKQPAAVSKPNQSNTIAHDTPKSPPTQTDWSKTLYQIYCCNSLIDCMAGCFT